LFKSPTVLFTRLLLVMLSATAIMLAQRKYYHKIYTQYMCLWKHNSA